MEDNAGICQLTEVLKITHTLPSFLFFSHGFIQIRFGLFFFFFFCYLSKFNAINFSLSEDIFSLQTHFFIDEKHAQWNLDTKAKVFHEIISCFMKCPWNFISWNALKENFHSVSLPLMPDIKLLEENDSSILRCKSCFFYLSDPLASLDCTHKTTGNSIATGLKIIERDL